MASTPFRRALFKRIKQEGGWSALLERVAGGETLASIARDFECSRSFLSRMLTRRSQPQLHEAYLAAKKESAASWAESAMQIIDDAPATRDDQLKAKNQAEHRRWLAALYDRETFGPPPPGPAVIINTGQLHLSALQAARPASALYPGARPALPPPSAALPAIEAEIIPSKESDT